MTSAHRKRDVIKEFKEHCGRHAYTWKLIDEDPQNHPGWSGGVMLAEHRLFRTKMCFYGPVCKFRDTCSFAHSEAELRQPTVFSHLDEQWTFKLEITTGREPIVVMGSPRGSFLDAKADVFERAMRGFADGPAAPAPASPRYGGGAAARAATRYVANAVSSSLSQTITKSLVRTCVMMLAEARFPEHDWRKRLGAKVGSSRPMLMRIVRDHYESFNKFLEWHQLEIFGEHAADVDDAAPADVAPQAATMGDAIEFMTSSRKGFRLFSGDRSAPHAAFAAELAEIVPEGGIMMRELTDELQGHRGAVGATTTFKVPYLLVYLRLFPKAYRVEHIVDLGDKKNWFAHRVFLVASRAAAPAVAEAQDVPADGPLAALLDRLGLGEFHAALASEDVTVDVLPLLELDDLLELGLPTSAAIKILAEFAPPSEREPPEPADAAPESDGYAAPESDTAPESDAAPESRPPEADGGAAARENERLRRSVAVLESRLAAFQARVAEMDRMILCRVCTLRKSDMVILPCAHAMHCAECLRGWDCCPTCGAAIEDRIPCTLFDEAVLR